MNHIDIRQTVFCPHCKYVIEDEKLNSKPLIDSPCSIRCDSCEQEYFAVLYYTDKINFIARISKNKLQKESSPKFNIVNFHDLFCR